MTKFSIQEFVSASIAQHQPKPYRPEPIRNLWCDCGKCPKQTITIKLAELPALATELGFSDMVTIKEFNKGIAHKFFSTKVGA